MTYNIYSGKKCATSHTRVANRHHQLNVTKTCLAMMIFNYFFFHSEFSSIGKSLLVNKFATFCRLLLITSVEHFFRRWMFHNDKCHWHQRHQNVEKKNITLKLLNESDAFIMISQSHKFNCARERKNKTKVHNNNSCSGFSKWNLPHFVHKKYIVGTLFSINKIKPLNDGTKWDKNFREEILQTSFLFRLMLKITFCFVYFPEIFVISYTRLKNVFAWSKFLYVSLKIACRNSIAKRGCCNSKHFRKFE